MKITWTGGYRSELILSMDPSMNQPHIFPQHCVWEKSHNISSCIPRLLSSLTAFSAPSFKCPPTCIWWGPVNDRKIYSWHLQGKGSFEMKAVRKVFGLPYFLKLIDQWIQNYYGATSVNHYFDQLHLHRLIRRSFIPFTYVEVFMCPSSSSSHFQIRAVLSHFPFIPIQPSLTERRSRLFLLQRDCLKLGCWQLM